jgi:hypothetical protein
MTRNAIFDQAEAAVTRLLDIGRVFITSGRVVETVLEMTKDAEVEVKVRSCRSGSWQIDLA